MVRQLILSILIISQTGIAQTDPYFAEKGYQLPKNSWVFSEEKAKDVRDKLIDLSSSLQIIESYKKSVLSYEKSLELSKKQLDLAMEQNDRLAKVAYSERTLTNIERGVWFTAGAAIVLGILYCVKQAAK